jgi:gluconolactonase
MLSYLVVLVLSPACAQPDPGKLPPPTGERIVPAGARLELLFTRTAPIKGGLTEGPAAAPDGSIYFSDIPFGKDKGMILRFDPKTNKTTVFAEDSHKSNGLAFDARGYLIACEGADGGGRCVARWDVKTGKRKVLAEKFMGKRFNSPNDLVIDTRGRIYFTDPRYVGPEPRELKKEAVYRLDPGGEVVRITDEVEKPNGIGLSPDGKTLYVADHNSGSERVEVKGPAPRPGAMKVYAFPLGPDGKVSGARKTLYDFGTEAGCDGLTVDVRGNLYLAARSLKRPGVLVLDPAGKEIAFIPTGPSQPGAKAPVGLPSNCEFGVGAESSTLYVTVDTSLYRIRLKVPGYRLPAAK